MPSVVDVVMLVVSALLGWFGVIVREQFGYPISLYDNLFAIPYFTWSAVMAAFYGHDLWCQLRRGRARRVRAEG
jgi:hypothetical protein